MKRIYKKATFIVGLVPHGYEGTEHTLKWRDSLCALYGAASAGRGSVNAWNDQAKGLVEVWITNPTLTRDLRSGKCSWFIANGPVLKIDENGPKI